jgi:hypothetical protein
MATHRKSPTSTSLLFSFTVLASLLLSACTKDPASPVIDESVPEIRNLVVDFGRYDSAMGRAGSIVFDPSKTKMFYEFNATVPTPEGPKILPTFEFYLHPDANIYAPADGYVTHFKFQAETGDYEIGITRSPHLTSSAVGMVTVDHIKDITVMQGAFVTAGQVLGKPGPWIEGIGRTELMVYQNDTAFCPFTFMTDSLKAGYKQKIGNLMADWEAYKRDTSLYHEEAMVEPGCAGWTGLP